MGLPSVSRLAVGGLAALRVHLRELGLDAQGIRSLTVQGDDLRTPLLPTRSASLRDDPQAVTLRLLFCREPVEFDLARESLGSVLLATLLAAGLVVPHKPGHVLAPFHVRTAGRLYLFSDYLGQEAAGVMGAGETTAILYRAGRPRGRVANALDLGCGAGSLALLLASQADEVIGTDINPRAVALARCNAALNEIENAEFRAGDLYAPVAGERFDLILSQPPYYPTPVEGGQLTFLHGGPRGDELSRHVVAGALAHLTEAGRALIFTSWPEPREAVTAPGACVLQLETNRLELQGTQQSITCLEHARDGAGWTACLTVPADDWGAATTARLNELMTVQALLHGPEERLRTARLQLVPGAERLQEGDDQFVRWPAEALIGIVRLPEAEWQLLCRVDRGEPVPDDEWATVRRAMQRGLLRVHCHQAPAPAGI